MMRTCTQNLPLFFSFVSLFVGLPAGAMPPGPDAICGDDYFFQVAGPEGWQLERQEARDGISLVYMPKEAKREVSPVVLAITLPRAGKRVANLDIDRVLNTRVANLVLIGDPREIRDEDIAHPTLPTRSVAMALPAGDLHLSLIDAMSGDGDYFVASLVKQGAVATASERSAFSATIASLAFDPTRACEGEGETAQVVKRKSAYPASPDPSAEAASPSDAATSAALERAFSGCHAMQRMLVPVTCSRANVAGEPALVLTFEDGSESAAVYLDRFRDRVAGTYCWARSQGALPPLFFRSKSKLRAPSALREYSCQVRDWGRSVAADAYTEID
jgi:hypothetical protein